MRAGRPIGRGRKGSHRPHRGAIHTWAACSTRTAANGMKKAVTTLLRRDRCLPPARQSSKDRPGELHRMAALARGRTHGNDVADASNRTGTNWAGNLTYHANAVQAPATREEAQACVRASERLRVLGSCHCFNDIADTTGTHLSLERLRRVVSLDRAVGQVTVEAGIRYSDLAPYLYEHGFALQNLASLPHITIAGACATATHGSGVGLGNLATQVAAMEFIDASGTFVTLSRTNDPDTFPGAVVNLGALRCGHQADARYSSRISTFPSTFSSTCP